MSFDGGSFRDPDGRVFRRDGRVLRGLTARGAAEWKAVSAAPFYKAAVEARRLVRSEERPAEAPWALVLEHEAVPAVSYPYEWGFAMLRDAALLTLDLQLEALLGGFTLKDGTPYNVQFVGTRPTFIDVGSFERLGPGAVWAGYRQFCEQFLYPLLLRAHRGMPHAPWLRGRLEGVRAAEAAGLLGLRSLLKPGVFAHVLLQARLQAGHASDAADLRGELAAAGAGPELVVAGLRKLRGVVAGLAWDPPSSPWSEYGRGEHYSAADLSAKEEFVRTAAAARPRRMAWDLGANRGDYARLLADHAAAVLAVDGDASAHEGLYRSLKAGGQGRILPLYMDLADPSPDQGWGGSERLSLGRRAAPDFVLALAVLHHLRLSAGVPTSELAAWLASLGAEAAVEFASKDDPAVRRLLVRKDDRYDDWTPAAFEAALAPRFETLRRAELCGGLRVLYHLRPLGGGPRPRP